MYDRPKESDWKAFRKLAPELRERYIGKLIPELVAILADEGKTSTERFWDLEERVAKEARILCRCLDGHSRSKMFHYLLLMHQHKMLMDEDLVHFSEELQERVRLGSGF